MDRSAREDSYIIQSAFNKKLFSKSPDHVAFCRKHVRDCGKSCKSLLVDINSEWITARNENVYSKVKLQSVNKKWLNKCKKMSCNLNSNGCSCSLKTGRDVISGGG